MRFHVSSSGPNIGIAPYKYRSRGGFKERSAFKDIAAIHLVYPKLLCSNRRVSILTRNYTEIDLDCITHHLSKSVDRSRPVRPLSFDRQNLLSCRRAREIQQQAISKIAGCEGKNPLVIDGEVKVEFDCVKRRHQKNPAIYGARRPHIDRRWIGVRQTLQEPPESLRAFVRKSDLTPSR